MRAVLLQGGRGRLGGLLGALLLAACAGPSQPPITWELVDPDPAGADAPTAIVPWTDGYLGVGEDTAWWTRDGRTWTTPPLPGIGEGSASDIAAAGGVAVAVGFVPKRPGSPHQVAAVWRTSDGAVFEQVVDPALAPLPGYASTSLDSVAAGRGGLVAVGTEWGDQGQRAVAWWSTDGRTWARSSTDLRGSGPRDVVATADGYALAAADVASAGEFVRAMFWFSDDGRSWSTAAVPELGGREPVGLAQRNGMLVAVGYRLVDELGLAPVAWRSQDGGRNWEEAADTPALDWWPLPEATPRRDGGAIQGSVMTAAAPAWGGFLAVGMHFGLNPRESPTDSTPVMMLRSGLWWTSDARTWERVPNDLVTVERETSGALARGLVSVFDAGGRPIVCGTSPDGSLVLWLGPAAATIGS